MDKNKIKSLCRQYEDNTINFKDFMDSLEKEGVPCHLVFVIGDLHRKVSYLTNICKLDEEDQKVAAKWEREREERRVIYNALADAHEVGDKDKAASLLNQLEDVPWECEHGRHLVKFCHTCDHIERTLFPDMFDEEDED